jgi:WD40 repeat protein/uncharacterized caspase-like protein
MASNYAIAQKPDIVVSTGHTSQINSVDISSDAKYIATGRVDKTIKIIETASGKDLRTIAENSQRVSVVKFDEKVQYIAAHIEGESLKIYDFESGSILSELPSDLADFDFCKDGNQVVYVDDDGKMNVANVLTGNKILETDISGISNLVVGTKSKNSVIIYDYKSNLKEVDLKSGAILKEVNIFPEYKYVTCRMAIDPSERWITLAVDGKQNGKDGEVHVFDRNTFKRIGVLKGHTGRIFDLTFSKVSGKLITTSHDSSTKLWDLAKMKVSETFSFRYTSSFALATHPFEGYFLIADMAKINYINESSGEIVRTFKPLGNSILNLAYDQIGNYLVSSGVNVSLKIWDLEQNKIARSIQGFWPIAFSPGGRELVSMYNGIALAVWDPNTGSQLHTLDTENELIQNIAYSKDGSMLAGGGFMGDVKLWDMNSHKMIKKFTGHVGGIYGTCFSPDGKLLASCGMDQTVRIWDIATGKELQKIEGHEILVSDVKFSPDGKYLATASWDKTVKIWSTKDWGLTHTLEGHTNMITTIDFSADGRFLASGAGNNTVAKFDNSVIIWDVEKGVQHCRYTGHRGMVQKVIFDQLSNYVFSTGDDGTIKVWDYDKCEEIATMASVGDDEFVIATPDNYYMSSKDALDAVSFRVKNKLYPFEQFDLKLNRPDIISSRLGKTPQGLINAYRYVYQKRLRKMGFTEDQLGDDFHLPEVEIINSSKTLTTDKKTFKFQAFLKDDKYQLDRLNVYVNNVPIYGISGFDLKDLKAQSVKKDIEIELSAGVNRIQVSTHNEKGVESLRETFKIIYNGEVQKGDLYIISIGVSKYKNEQFNLKYAAKDAKDVMETITGKSAHLYKSIKQRLLTDEEVTKSSITGLKDFISNAKPEDAVIIFVAGHGLLDKHLDYYYATHNVDFNEPNLDGVSYELLESLLSITKAYEKLLIMDTCHSGELDKDEVEEGKNEDVNLGDVQFRAVGVSVREKEGFGMENTKELMDEMFTDVRKGTGATVISSAGGAEFAMESAEWKNGLFTYCLLEGLTSKAADANHDNEIKVSELRDYVYTQVTKLSNGKQKPTARSENLSIDYRIW